MNEQLFYTTTGKTIQRRRKANKLTQADIGHLIGCSQQTINDWESGRRRPAAYELIRMCKILGIKPDDIFGLVDAVPWDREKPLVDRWEEQRNACENSRNNRF